MTELQPIRKVVLRANDNILAERADAARIRDRDLMPQPLDRPISLDLSALRIITFSAADELIVHWLVVARSEDRDQAVVAALYSPHRVVHETLHAALKARRQAAYASARAADPSNQVMELIGDVSRVNETTLRAVEGHDAGVTASELAKELGLAETAASARLQELVEKGLLVRGAKTSGKTRGRPSTVFHYPFPSPNAKLRQRSKTLRPAPAS